MYQKCILKSYLAQKSGHDTSASISALPAEGAVTTVLIYIYHSYSSSVLDNHCPAEFSSYPDQTHLNKLINVFQITRKLQWPFRTEVRVSQPWCSYSLSFVFLTCVCTLYYLLSLKKKMHSSILFLFCFFEWISVEAHVCNFYWSNFVVYNKKILFYKRSHRQFFFSVISMVFSNID